MCVCVRFFFVLHSEHLLLVVVVVLLRWYQKRSPPPKWSSLFVITAFTNVLRPSVGCDLVVHRPSAHPLI